MYFRRCCTDHNVLQFATTNVCMFSPDTLKVGHTPLASRSMAVSALGVKDGSRSRLPSRPGLQSAAWLLLSSEASGWACVPLVRLGTTNAGGDWSMETVRSDLIFRAGQREMPNLRISFLSDVTHMPSCFAASRAGMWKHALRSCSVRSERGICLVASRSARLLAAGEMTYFYFRYLDTLDDRWIDDLSILKRLFLVQWIDL
jgi:hypothetical protein